MSVGISILDAGLTSMSRRVIYLLLAAVVAGLSACGGGGSSSGSGSGTPSFSLAVSPTTLSVAQGSAASTTLTVTPSGGMTGTVSLTATGLPTGVTFAPTSVNVTGSSPVTATLTLTAISNATTGNATVTLSGSGGGVQASTTLTLSVTANTPSTSYYVSSTYPAAGSGPQYISDPFVLYFSKAPDVTINSQGNPQGTTVSAVTVTPISGNVPTPLAVRFIYSVNSPNLGPDALGVKFFAVAGATYQISVASSAKAADGSAFSGPAVFNVTLPATPPLPAPVKPVSTLGYFYGVIPQVHFNNNTQVYGWVQQLGAQVVRIGTDMTTDEPTQGNFNWSTLDQWLSAMNAIHVPADVLIVQYNAPAWANGLGSGSPPPGSGYIACTPQIYAAFVQAVVHHILVQTHNPAYPGSEVAAIELGNEPDTPSFWNVDTNNPQCAPNATPNPSSDASKYIPYLQQAYAAGKTEANTDGYQNLLFLNAGVASNAYDESYFQQIAQAGNYEDAFAIHLYAWADPNSPYPSRSWESFQVLPDDGTLASQAGQGAKHFWVTEGAFQSNPACPDGVDETTKGYFLAEDYNRMAALTSPVVDSFTYFELQDSTPVQTQGDPCFSSGNGFGLVDDTGTLEPAFLAFQHLTGAGP